MDGANLRIHLFTCSTSLDPGQLLDVENALPEAELKIISLPCSGKVNVPYLVKAFESGAHGVVVITCKKEDCRYIQGSSRAEKRVAAVDDLMAEIGLGHHRVALISLDDRGIDGVIDQLKAFHKTISALSTPKTNEATCKRTA